MAALRAAQGSSSGPRLPDEVVEPSAAPSWAERGLVAGLGVCGSLLLLAVTAHITQHIVPAPLLWVVPLGVYLLSFVVCFEWPRLYWRPVWIGLLPVALVGMAYLARQGLDELTTLWRVALFVAGLLVCCMVCHGEIARRRPGAEHLTAYYLLIALGGALGGLLGGVAAPLLSRYLVELPVGLILTGAFGALVSLQALWPRLGAYGRLPAVAVLWFALGIYATHAVEGMRASTRGYRLVTRSFYGQLAVREDGQPGSENASRSLIHGGIIHGTQWWDDARRRLPTTYYCETSGVGRALALLPTDRGRRVGMIGLGAGTLVAFGRPDDVYRVYEINPQVLRLAETDFTFLHDTASRGRRRDRRRAAEARRGAAPGVRSDRRRRVLRGLDSGAPPHAGGARALCQAPRARWHPRRSHLEPLRRLRPGPGRRSLGDPAPGGQRHTPMGMASGSATARSGSSSLPSDGRRRYPALWEFGSKLEPTRGFRPWTDDLWSLYPVLRKGTS